jgi:hypothetical protein
MNEGNINRPSNNEDKYKGLHLVPEREKPAGQPESIPLYLFTAVRTPQSSLAKKLGIRSKIERVEFSETFFDMLHVRDFESLAREHNERVKWMEKTLGCSLDALNKKREELDKIYREKTEAPGLVNG